MHRFGALVCALSAFFIAGAAHAGSHQDVYSQDFEAGPTMLPASEWSTNSTLAIGRVEVSDYSAHGGRYALHMDASAVSAIHNLNEAVLTIDLSNASDVLLEFWHADWDGPAGSTSFNGSFAGSFDADGIAISADGSTWYPVWQAATQNQDEWHQYTVDLSAAAESAGISLGANFRIKFQQYDNFPRPVDGRAWDDITVTATVEEPAPEEEAPETDPRPEIDLREYIATLPREAFKRGHPVFRYVLYHKVKKIERAIYRGRYQKAERRILRLWRRVDGCSKNTARDVRPDRRDWVWDCEAQWVIRTELEAWLSELR